MSTPLEISFHGLERSDAVEARIRDKFNRLQHHFDRIMHARVVIETPRKHTLTAKVFHVKIELLLPGQKPLVVCNEPEPEQTRTDLSTSIRDAFAAARRRLDEAAAKIKHPAKRERARRRPNRKEVAVS
ncbi:MAG: HPF/RaiA family ribosome-associated protein [Bacteroidota bacterium]|jgi:ribosome-associated translation inhibitor RaiA